jgi:hypothetical protein
MGLSVNNSITFHFSLFLFAFFGWVSPGFSQEQAMEMPQPSAEHEVLKHEAGTWKADATFFMPDGSEMKAVGKETNRMIGGFWIVSDFAMDMGGAPFHGHGTFGYDSKNKKYTGSWVDSMSPHVLHMTGTWDAATRTFTHLGDGLDMMGNPEKSKSTVVFSEDMKTRTFDRWVQAPGAKDWTKAMTIVYTKEAQAEPAGR